MASLVLRCTLNIRCLQLEKVRYYIPPALKNSLKTCLKCSFLCYRPASLWAVQILQMSCSLPKKKKFSHVPLHPLPSLLVSLFKSLLVHIHFSVHSFPGAFAMIKYIMFFSAMSCLLVSRQFVLYVYLHVKMRRGWTSEVLLNLQRAFSKV